MQARSADPVAVQNSKLVKALQDSGLAAETGAERVGVFGLENVRAAVLSCADLCPAGLRPATVMRCACVCVCVSLCARVRVLQYGNTCYCNSVLQALYFCKPFRERVSSYRPKWLPDGEKVRDMTERNEWDQQSSSMG